MLFRSVIINVTLLIGRIRKFHWISSSHLDVFIDESKERVRNLLDEAINGSHECIMNVLIVTRDGVKYVFVFLFKYVDLVYFYLYLKDYSVMYLYLYLIVEFGVFDQIHF